MSMISFFGGKAGSAFQTFINPNIPKSGIRIYCEPCSGSMASYMDDDSLNFETVIYNDKNRHLVNLMYCCSKPEQFLEVLDKLKTNILYTEETDSIKKWDFYKSIYHKYTKNNFLDDNEFEIGDFKRAAIYGFLATSAFSGTFPGTGGGFSGYIKSKDRLKLEILINKLKKGTYTNKLNSITKFYNIDFEELIKKYDSEDTYFYLDPPYARMSETSNDDSKRLSWYGSESETVFGPSSHRRLLELIKTCKSRWSISYYYFPLLEELLPKDKYIWLEKEVRRPSAQGGNNSENKGKQVKGTELLILNYDPKTGNKL